jgi:hypothetical protein
MTTKRGVDHAVKLMSTIREVRAEYSACTAREVARRCKLGHTLVVGQLRNLRTAGYVTWTEHMPGSLKLTPAGGKFLAKHTPDAVADDESAEQTVE